MAKRILKLESGNPATSLATMFLVLKALGMSADIDAIAAQDPQPSVTTHTGRLVVR